MIERGNSVMCLQCIFRQCEHRCIVFVFSAPDLIDVRVAVVMFYGQGESVCVGVQIC